ncbi:MAG: hypothetical protein LBI80_05825 [Endomicrobium sp.]|jgi:hypothetical protein|nr:hypothetical protein [Endomicrobium sp.]
MVKKLISCLVLLFSIVHFMFAAENFNSKEIVLEEPYNSGQRQEANKNVKAQEFISENVSSVYDKASTIKNNFEINKLFESIKKFVISVKGIVLKIKLFILK